jgi:hypothetical protein
LQFKDVPFSCNVAEEQVINKRVMNKSRKRDEIFGLDEFINLTLILFVINCLTMEAIPGSCKVVWSFKLCEMF